MTKETLIRYAKSSAVTFTVGFGIVFVGEIDNITLTNIGTSTFTGVIFAATRAGVKALFEAFLFKNKKK